MSDMEKYLQSRLAKDPEFKRIYEERKSIKAIIFELVRTRIKKGLSQKELAEKAGLKQPAIGRMESGDTVPNLKTICKVAGALDLQIKAVENSTAKLLDDMKNGNDRSKLIPMDQEK